MASRKLAECNISCIKLSGSEFEHEYCNINHFYARIRLDRIKGSEESLYLATSTLKTESYISHLIQLFEIYVCKQDRHNNGKTGNRREKKPLEDAGVFGQEDSAEVVQSPRKSFETLLKGMVCL